MSALTVTGLGKSFGGFQALRDVSLAVSEGERRAIIGANGAGKSTLFNLIGGQISPTTGSIRLRDEDVTGLEPFAMWRKGLTRTFQKNSAFPSLSVAENVRLAVIARRRLGARLFSSPARDPQVARDVQAVLERVGLAERTAVTARGLAYGEQRQLELAIALAGGPHILLLDEPTAGMSPAETRTMIDMLAQLPPEITLLIVEHDMDVVFALADRITVLHLGELLAEGTPEEIERDERVIQAYLERPEEVA